MITKKMYSQIVSLPIEDRVALTDSLLKSLNQTKDDIDKKWIDVATKRLKEIRKGSVIAIDGQKVFERIEKKFSK